MTMKRPILMLLGVIVVAGVLVSSATARPTQSATGHGVIAPVQLVEKHVGDTTILYGVAAGSLTGTLTGTITEFFFSVVRPDGSGEIRAVGVFSGTIGHCGPATVPFTLNLKGTLASYAGSSGTPPGVAPRYEIQITGGGADFTYSGNYDC